MLELLATCHVELFPPPPPSPFSSLTLEEKAHIHMFLIHADIIRAYIIFIMSMLELMIIFIIR